MISLFPPVILKRLPKSVLPVWLLFWLARDTHDSMTLLNVSDNDRQIKMLEGLKRYLEIQKNLESTDEEEAKHTLTK